MSIYFADEMAAAGLSALDLQKHWGVERYTVVAFTAKDLRDQGERLWRDPNEDFVGHGACKRDGGSERTRSEKRNLAKLAKVVDGLG